MKYTKLACGLALLGAAAFTAQAQYTITTLDVPGNPYTTPHGISGNNIAGITSDAFLNQSGFIYNGSSYTLLTCPLGDYTSIFGISGNSVVGTYVDATDGYATKGFIYDGTTYTTLDIPGSTSSGPLGISADGIVGYYNTADGNQHGFLMAQAVPEPSTLALAGLGGLALLRYRRRK